MLTIYITPLMSRMNASIVMLGWFRSVGRSGSSILFVIYRELSFEDSVGLSALSSYSFFKFYCLKLVMPLWYSLEAHRHVDT